MSYICFPEGMESMTNLTKILTCENLPIKLLNHLMNFILRTVEKLDDEMFFLLMLGNIS